MGIDFSHGFIDACNKLKTYGKLPFTVQTEGSLVSEHVAEVDPEIVSKPVCLVFCLCLCTKMLMFIILCTMLSEE